MSASLEGLGDRIRKARVEAGLSQAELGRPHFTRAYVSALELGKIRPAMQSLEFLATKLGKPVAYFVEDEEQERERQARELAVVRANQLIAQGSANDAIDELAGISLENASTTERLAVKRTLGRAHLEAGHPSKAAALLREALNGYQAIGDKEQTARSQAQLGRALSELMNYPEAEEYLQAALRATASGDVRDPLFRVHVLHNLGFTYYYRDNYRAALEQFERAAQEGADVADQRWQASLYAAMGMSRRQIGDYEGAVTYLLKSEAIFEALHNRSRVAEIRFQAARALRALGNKTRAREMFTEATRAADSLGDVSLSVRIQAFLALTLAQDGDVESAREILEALTVRADLLDDPRARFAARFTLAKVVGPADPPRAEQALRTMAADLEAMGASGELAEVFDELSRVLTRQGRSEEAVAFAQRAYAVSQRVKGGV